jgi:hypothetical protein
MNFYRSFDMGTPAIRAIPAIPEPSNSEIAKIARVLSSITLSLAMLADAREGLPITPDQSSTAHSTLEPARTADRCGQTSPRIHVYSAGVQFFVMVRSVIESRPDLGAKNAR